MKSFLMVLAACLVLATFAAPAAEAKTAAVVPTYSYNTSAFYVNADGDRGLTFENSPYGIKMKLWLLHENGTCTLMESRLIDGPLFPGDDDAWDGLPGDYTWYTRGADQYKAKLNLGFGWETWIATA